MQKLKCKIAVFVTGVLAAFLSLSFAPVVAECGVSRWEVKVLADADASKVKYKVPKKTTIKKLIALKTPETGHNTPRLKMERQTYRIDCYIEEYKKEDDKDYHLIIRDGEHGMVAEIVNPTCPDADRSKHVESFKKVRDLFDQYRKNGEYKKHRWRITGVAFVDVKHGTRPKGSADNRIELHPVLNLQVLD